MEKYLNLNGDSGVDSYEIGSDFIKVLFLKTSYLYTYSYRKAGKFHVDNMKILAEKGRGLNSYINKNVYKLYDN